MAAKPDFFRGKRVALTGASGFIGSNLLGWLRRAGAKVIVAKGDVSKKSAWRHILNGADIVFHLAAQTSASAAEADPAWDFEQNVLPMLRLLEQCRRSRRRPAIVFASTATIAGLPARLPVNETFPDRPITVYDTHKKMAEDCLKHYARLGLARGVCLRLCNVYGPGPLSRKPDRGVLNAMIAKALRGEALDIYGKGDRLRDYVFIDDVVEAFAAAARRADALSGRSFIIGSGRGHAIGEAIRLVAARVARSTGVRARVRRVRPPAPAAAIEARHFIADSRRFARATGWKAEVSLADGIDRVIASATR